MKDPALSSDGYSYERKAIEKWSHRTRTQKTSPITNLPLSNYSLTPNFALKSIIEDY